MSRFAISALLATAALFGAPAHAATVIGPNADLRIVNKVIAPDGFSRS
jgi:hypothetical protein